MDLASGCETSQLSGIISLYLILFNDAFTTAAATEA
jgi:hypothetical protein